MRMILSLICLATVFSLTRVSAAVVALPGGKVVVPAETTYEVKNLNTKSETITLKADEKMVSYEIAEKEVIFDDLDCSLVDESRVDPRWAQYESLLKSETREKAQLLRLLINGLSDSEAKFLVEKGYFSKRPKGWNSFKEETRKIDGENANAGAFFFLVVDKDNSVKTQASLGVARQQCSLKQTRLPLRQISSKESDVVGSKTSTIVLNFSNPSSFVPGDRFFTRFDGQETSVLPDVSNSSLYQVSTKDGKAFHIRWKERVSKPVDWANTDLSLNRDLRHKSLRLRFKDGVASEPRGKVVVEYELYRYRLLKDVDFLVLKEERILDGHELNLDLRKEVDEKGAEEWRPGDSYYVSLRFRRLEDPQHSSEPSETKKTERLAAPL